MTFALTPAAIQNAPLLRRIARGEPPIETIEGLARDFARDPSNMRKTLKRLLDDGILDPFETVRQLKLSETGARALAAIEIADGAEISAAPLQDPSGRRSVLCTRDEIEFNPMNPRKKIDPAGIEALAASVHASDGFEQAPSVLPPNDEGKRILYAGERRMRALDLLIAQGLWDPARPFLCIEREPDPAHGIFVALSENGPRDALTSFEIAKALAELCELTGWSARRAAMDTGAVDVRTAQEMMRVFREGAPELIAQWEGGLSWEKAREEVRKPKPQTDVEGAPPAIPEISPRLGMALLELAWAVRTRPAQASGFEGYTRLKRLPDSGGSLNGLAELGWIQYRRQGETVFARILRASTQAGAWLDREGFDADPDNVLWNARARRLGPGVASRLAKAASFATPELDLAGPDRDEEPSAEAVDVDLPLAEAAPRQPEPECPFASLTPREKLAVIEIAYKRQVDGVERFGQRCAITAEHWTAREPQSLINKRLLSLAGLETGQGWGAALTSEPPATWIASNWVELRAILKDELNVDLPDARYLTPWLNAEAAESQSRVPVTAEDMARGEALRRAMEAEADAMAQVHEVALHAARCIQASRVWDFPALKDAFAACQHPLPWRLDADHGWVDAEGREIDLFGRHDGALRALIVATLNAAAGADAPDALAIEGVEA